jgi:hypothetical protein
MKPLPTERPVLWVGRKFPFDFEVNASRADFERRWGPPHLVDREGDGLGPEEYWGWHCDCGLEVVVLHLPRYPVEDMFLVTSEYREVEHVLAHVGWKPELVTWLADAAKPFTKGWVVVRQDDTGNRYDICVAPVRAHADCYAALMEARAHKQSYSVEVRGTPPTLERAREGWAVIRQDDHGNRAEVVVHPSLHVARGLAAAYEAEPRHKQTYFVEPVTPSE